MLPPLVDQESFPDATSSQISSLIHAIQTVDNFNRMIERLSSAQTGTSEIDWPMENALIILGKFSNQIASYFAEEITPGRSKAALAFFSTLLQDIGIKDGVDQELGGISRSMVSADLAWEMAKRLQLSNAESEWVRKMVGHRMTVQTLMQDELFPDQRKVYRFFKEVGNVGVALAVHILAETMACDGSTMTPEHWEKALTIVLSILSAWWDYQDTIISPTPLLNGDDLQRIFDLEPGKRIGHLLDQLVEEQASGNIFTQDEAEDFIRRLLTRGRYKGDKR